MLINLIRYKKMLRNSVILYLFSKYSKNVDNDIMDTYINLLVSATLGPFI